MPTPKSDQVIPVIREAADFTRRMGFDAEADALSDFVARFEKEKLTFKILRGPVQDAKDNASRKIREGRFYDADRSVKPEMRAEHDEYVRIWIAFQDILYPQEHKPTIVKGLVPGNDRETSVLGDVSAARQIAERSLEAAQRFSEAVIHNDVETAYALCAKELKSSMSVRRFTKQLELVDGEREGYPTEYAAKMITWIYSDEAPRNKSNKDGDWPGDTPKQNKRAILVGAWLTRDNTGELQERSICFWMTQEQEEYRIAKFQQYYQ